MAFEGKALTDITEADLQSLLGQAESATLEFKSTLYGHTSGGRKEFLKDVTAFANTVGGLLLIGVGETDSVATSIDGVDVAIDDEKLRMENMVRDGVSPRLADVQIHFIVLENTRKIILIRISQSWDAPHRVTLENSQRFYARATNSVYEPDVHQLRGLFMKSASAAEQLRERFKKRLATYSPAEGYVQGAGGPYILYQILPYSCLNSLSRLGMAELNQHTRQFLPEIDVGSVGTRINLDGIVNFGGQPPHDFYGQVSRDGSVETFLRIESNTHYEGSALFSNRDIEPIVVSSIHNQLQGLLALGIGGPYVIFTALTGFRDGYFHRYGESLPARGLHKFSQAVMTLPEIFISEPPATRNGTAMALKDLCDSINHAAGYNGSVFFDNEGRWDAG